MDRILEIRLQVCICHYRPECLRMSKPLALFPKSIIEPLVGHGTQDSNLMTHSSSTPSRRHQERETGVTHRDDGFCGEPPGALYRDCCIQNLEDRVYIQGTPRRHIPDLSISSSIKLLHPNLALNSHLFLHNVHQRHLLVQLH